MGYCPRRQSSRPRRTLRVRSCLGASGWEDATRHALRGWCGSWPELCVVRWKGIQRPGWFSSFAGFPGAWLVFWGSRTASELLRCITGLASQ